MDKDTAHALNIIGYCLSAMGIAIVTNDSSAREKKLIELSDAVSELNKLLHEVWEEHGVN